jgi:hypothetical protein
MPRLLQVLQSMIGMSNPLVLAHDDGFAALPSGS